MTQTVSRRQERRNRQPGGIGLGGMFFFAFLALSGGFNSSAFNKERLKTSYSISAGFDGDMRKTNLEARKHDADSVDFAQWR